MGAIRGARSLRFRVLLAKPHRPTVRDFKLDTFFTFYETFKTPFSKIGRSAASMAALRAGTNTEKSRSRYVKPSLEGRFQKKISDRAEKGSNRRLSHRKESGGVLHSPVFFDLANDFARALIRKIT